MAIRKAQAKTSQKNTKKTRHRVINLVLQKKAPYTSSKKTLNTLLHEVSHNYVIVSLLIIQQ